MMLRRIWLVLAQGLVLLAAALFVVLWLLPFSPLPGFSPPPRPAAVVTVKEAPEVAPGKPTPMSFRAAAAKAQPAVLNIYAAKAQRARALSPEERLLRRFYGLPDEDPQDRFSLGSGVIVSADGYILTNNHVVEGADQIAVALADGREARARLVGADPDTDLAVLRIEAERLPAITFGDSDQLRAGDVVLAIGNPFGVGQTVTMGIVSATGRNRVGINTFENFIQTDAAVNPGNSGGALVDSSGHLVGINTAIYSQTGSSAGIGFAIPAKMARSVMEQLITTGRVERGWLGVEIADVTPEAAARLKLAKAGGAVVARLVRGGPAHAAGLQPGDVVTAIDGKEIADARSVIDATATLRPGARALLKVVRGGKPIEVSVTLGERPAPPRVRE